MVSAQTGSPSSFPPIRTQRSRVTGNWVSFHCIRQTFLLLILFLIPGVVMVVAYGLISLELYQGIKFDASQKKSAKGTDSLGWMFFIPKELGSSLRKLAGGTQDMGSTCWGISFWDSGSQGSQQTQTFQIYMYARRRYSFLIGSWVESKSHSRGIQWHTEDPVPEACYHVVLVDSPWGFCPIHSIKGH